MTKRAKEPKYPYQRRDEIPEPEWRCPDCGICGQEMWHDGDSLRCDTCGYHGEQGHWTWDDEFEPQCSAVLAPHADADPERYPNIIGMRVPCLLGAYHVHSPAPRKPKDWWGRQEEDKRLHRGDGYEWADGDPREVVRRRTDESLYAAQDGIAEAVERAGQHRRDEMRRRHEEFLRRETAKAEAVSS